VSEQLLNLIRREIAVALTLRATTRVGLVTSYDAATHAAKVTLQPEGTLSGWLPVGTPRAGAGAGMALAPNAGDQVMVHFLEDDPDSGVVGLRLYSTRDPPPAAPAGQMWIVDDAGTSIKLTNDGNLALAAPNGACAVAVSGQGMDVSGPNGNLSVSGTLGTAQGASGSFTAQSGQIVTVVQGIVTRIE
ncbi:MAG: phage baseplate assembly protein V, partial [Caulobacteraceae bacterium]